MCWVRSDLLLHSEVRYGPQSVQSPRIALYFFKGFLEVVARESAVAEAP